MKKMRFLLMPLFTFMLFNIMLMCNITYAMPNPSDWYWISSDTKYTKYFAPKSIETKKFGNIAYQISAKTRTDYSIAGAQETLNNYSIDNIDASKLAYSLADIEINPQNRTFSYLNETFYDANDNVLWSKVSKPVRPKEMNSQEFDEDFYAMIVDSVFGMGEFERRNASDRWLTLWNTTQDGLSYTAIADTTTMRIKADNIIFWQWQTVKDSAGNVKEIMFQKINININQGTGKVTRYQHWEPNNGWEDFTNKAERKYHILRAGSNEAIGLNILRNYIKNNNNWVYRYSIER